MNRPKAKTAVRRTGVAGRKSSSGTKVSSTAGPTFRNVNLRIHKVTCVKTTKEIDKDEIVVTAIKTVGKVENKHGKKRVAGKSHKGKIIDAGKFKKGGEQTYRTPRVVVKFPVGGKTQKGTRNYVATLILIEKDEGTIGTIVNKVINEIDKVATEAIATAVAGVAGGVLSSVAAGAAIGSAVPLIGTAIGAAAGAAVTAAFGAIKRGRADDVFPPKKIPLKLPSYPSKKGEVKNSKKTAIFKAFGGHYKVVYSWGIV